MILGQFFMTLARVRTDSDSRKDLKPTRLEGKLLLLVKLVKLIRCRYLKEQVLETPIRKCPEEQFLQKYHIVSAKKYLME